MTVEVECGHAGAIIRRTYDPKPYCPVCWEVKRWAEWFEILEEMAEDGGDE
jgi:hypothetical protein